MQVIILAAGMGRRLGELTGGNTKCMLEVSGVTLIDRMLENISYIDVTRIVIVIGYKGKNVINHVGSSYKGVDVVYVENSIYDKTNNIYSLFFDKVYGDLTGQVKEFKHFDKFKIFNEFAKVIIGDDKGRENNKERILVYNVGMAVHDIFIGNEIFKLIKKQSINTLNIPFKDKLDKFFL